MDYLAINELSHGFLDEVRVQLKEVKKPIREKRGYNLSTWKDEQKA